MYECISDDLAASYISNKQRNIKAEPLNTYDGIFRTTQTKTKTEDPYLKYALTSKTMHEELEAVQSKTKPLIDTCTYCHCGYRDRPTSAPRTARLVECARIWRIEGSIAPCGRVDYGVIIRMEARKKDGYTVLWAPRNPRLVAVVGEEEYSRNGRPGREGC